MKSMSIEAQGMSRLYCGWRWAMGLLRVRRPLIHILDGENVWHQVMRPIQLGELWASRQSSDTASGVVSTGLNTALTGISLEPSRPVAISFESTATCFRV